MIFLAEAFTRPAMMRTLAQVGFQQSYTYFTWRNTKQELTEYAHGAGEGHGRVHAAQLLREHPGHPARLPSERRAPRVRGARRARRDALADLGRLRGYELCENAPLRPGSEEYLHSEKYELRPRDWESAEHEGRSIAPLITRLNGIRRRSPALQQLRDVHFHHTDKTR